MKLTRKDFLRGGAALAAASSLPALPASASGSAAAPASGKGPAVKPSAAGIDKLNPVIRLYPEKSVFRSGNIRFGVGELEMMLPFLGTGEIIWNFNVIDPGRYRIALCYSTVKEGQPVTLTVNGKQDLNFSAPVTKGYFIPHPQGPVDDPGDPDTDGFWRMREYYLFERKPVEGEVDLVRGVNVVKLKVTAPKGKEVFRLRSVELTPVAKLAEIEADLARQRANRANTDWFADAGYGLWFHFIEQTTPRSGPRKPYKEAVDALDVKAIAKTVADCGARYLIWAVNHGSPHCPAPIKSWERLHPGTTTKRDLLMELADELAKYRIELMLYQNCPGTGKLIQQHQRAIDTPTFSEAEYAAQIIEVFEEFGARYGTKVKGWWLDSWFQTMESYPNLPNEAIDRAIKSGNKDCMSSFNGWAFPNEVECQDYWCGEITDLPAKPFGSRYLKDGPAAGMQAHSAIKLDAPWFHITENKEMEPPLYSARELADYIRLCQRDRAPVTLGVGIFQDGTIGEKSYAVLKELKSLIRKDRKRR
ncbi:hypothetical protein [Sphingomonas sp. G-3-2-10]|uniref:alpha-L-fucosidase n=1 Tax=Sphingomonas sp. G-3-2-10 TaxID=2728838 RepID=UPI00146C9E76|nr:hypothetical protein [Sphingomonas sp. G-3-2-10]NML07828.1 hypothetical protein [Sphingomonas sp. G-3-2-10]